MSVLVHNVYLRHHYKADGSDEVSDSVIVERQHP